MMTTTLPPKRKPTRAELLSYIPGASIPPKPTVVAVPDLKTDWDAFTKALADRPAPEIIQTRKLPAFVREALETKKLEELNAILAKYAAVNEEIAVMSPLNIRCEMERQKNAFRADPQSSNQPEEHAEIELRWRLRREGVLQKFYAAHGSEYAAALKPLVTAARDVVRKRLRDLIGEEDAAAASMGCPPPAPNWYARNLLKMENALSNDLAGIEEFTVELARFQKGGSGGSGLSLPGNYFKILITSTP